MKKRLVAVAGVVGLGALWLAASSAGGGKLRPYVSASGGDQLRPTTSAADVIQAVGTPQLMPPHPRILKPGPDGRVLLPRAMADRTFARRLGINQPRRVPGRAPATGTINALAVVVDFSTKVSTVTASYFDTLIFGTPTTGRGSVRDYYDEVSYGQVDIVTLNLPSSLTWRRAPQTYAYYTGGAYGTDAPYPNNCQKLAEDIVDALDAVVDFSRYDNDGDGYAEPLMIVHAGPGAEYTGSVNDIWSHSWGLNSARNYDGVWITDYVIMPEYWTTVSAATSDMTIGVFAHEMGHGFWGLPDLYDRDSSSYGIGKWSLMAGGSWNGPSPGGASPAWPDAWSRIQMGFATPTATTTNGTSITLQQTLDHPAPDPTIRKLRSPRLAAQEYFLLENRQQVSGGYDEYLRGEGLLIWHVDEAMWSRSLQNDYECRVDPHSSCSETQHFLVALEQADGLHQLESKLNSGDAADPFPGTGGNRSWTAATHPETSSYYVAGDTGINVTNISNSSSLMTFDLAIDPTLTIADAPDVTEGAGVTASFVVTLSTTSLETVTVDYAATGMTATAGSDFTAVTGTLTFLPGELQKTLLVPILNDSSPENEETLRVTLSNVVEANATDTEAEGTIIDNDTPSIGVSIGDASVLEGNAGMTAMVFTVTATAPVPIPMDVNFTTSPGTATAVTDYAPSSGRVTIPTGQTSATLAIAVKGDRLVERDETFNVDLLASWGFELEDARGVGRILNDDTSGLSIGNVMVREGRPATFVVRLSAALTRFVTVRFATANGTALAPYDYVGTKGTLTFAPGVTTQVVRVPTRADGLAEGNETFAVVLSAPSGAPLVGTGIGTAKIQD